MSAALHQQSACRLREQLANGALTAVEVLEAFLARIDAVNPRINAICTLVPERARREAELADQRRARGGPLGLLHGLPIAIKDLVDTEGIRTTQGSPLFERRVPERDALIVERIRAAGAIVIGKTNVPEFGAGSHTFNPVFGATRNPYDLDKSAGGSSGGAAAALASRMLPIADGSDMGGSLRNPGAFNNVIGLRPTPGRVPRVPNPTPWDTLSVLGPMARDIPDLRLLLAAIAGPDVRDPLSLPEPGAHFLEPVSEPLTGKRIAWTPDLGRLAVERENVAVCERALDALRDLGCKVEPAAPDLGETKEPFLALRAAAMAAQFPPDLEKLRGRVKDTILWNAQEAYARSGADLGRAMLRKGEIHNRAVEFMQRYDFLVLPTTQVAPFPIDDEWVHEIEGCPMESYIDWMESCWAITLTSLPAISVPAGLTAQGLPVGLQIVGPPRGERELLALAHAFERRTRHAEIEPKR